MPLVDANNGVSQVFRAAIEMAKEVLVKMRNGYRVYPVPGVG